MFVRVKTTPNSPRRSVQVVQTSRVGDKVSQRIVRHMGIALDASEEAKLRLMAQEYIDQSMAEQLDATSLFATQAGLLRRPGRPARQTLASVSPASGVNLGDVLETARRIEGPHEVLGHLYDYLRFDRLLACAPDALAAAAVSATASAVDTLTQSAGADSCVKDAKDKGMQGVKGVKGVNSAPASGSSSKGTAMLRDLVIARVMAPASKHESARALEADYGKSYTSDSLYRLMDAVYERLDSLKRIVFEATASLVGGHVDLMLFDITTLYFESVQTDELRAFGYSKDQKYHCTQVVLALATNEDGLPIGYELFAGNTAEVKTLIACMQSWQTKLAMGRVSFVADRALCSKANLDLLEQGGWSYVVAMPLRRSLKQTQQAQILQTQTAVPKEIEGDLLWVREFDWLGRRLIVTYSSKRAHKDQADRQALVDKLTAKLGKSSAAKATKVKANTDTTADTAADTTANANKAGAVKTAGASKPGSANAKKLITNSGYLKYIEQADTGGVFVLDEDKLLADSAWDGLHAIVTNDTTSSASALLTRYRRLWVIEDSFRLIKHNLAIRPIYHFKPERIKAHIGICFLAFALLRHAQQRIKLAQGAMSTEQIKRALHGVQASVLTHKKTHAKYRLPSSFSHDAGRIYKAFGLSRSLDADVLI